MPNARNLKTGTQLGRYFIKKLIGRGAVATVYLAEDTALGVRVALKALHADKESAGEDAAERMRREIGLARQLAHPGICQVYDMHEEQGLLFLTMAFIHGRTLERVIENEGKLAPRRTARIMRQVCNALGEAHGLGILHRDLKPGNIMLGVGDKPIILDFGYATGPDVARLTATGVWVGTLQYVAPEQLQNERATVASDVYSLGVTLYRCLTGTYPFQGVTFGEIASAVLYRVPASPSEHVPDLDPALEAVVIKAMQRDPRERYASVADLEAALAEHEGDDDEATNPAATITVADAAATQEDAGASTTEKAVLLASVLVCRPSGAGWLADDDVTTEDRLSLLERFILPEIDTWRGTMITSGRAGLAAWYASADDAARSAMAIQRTVETYRMSLPRRAPQPLVRIGVQTGLARFEGRDVTGDVVDQATAVSDWASSGEIVLTAQTVNALGKGLAALSTRAGAHCFGSPEPLALYQLDWQESARTVMAANPLADEKTVVGRPLMSMTDESTPAELEPAAPTGRPAGSAATPASPEAPTPEPIQEETPEELRKLHAALSEELAVVKRNRGLIAGDSATIDSLVRTAMLELSRGRWPDAVDCLRLAIRETSRVSIDESFVGNKIQRLDAAMREAGAYAHLDTLQPILDAIMAAFERGDFQAANRALNRARETLAAPRRLP